MAGLDITKEGNIEDFLGVNIDKAGSNTYHLSHPQLINQILSDLVFSYTNTTPSTKPDLATNILGYFQGEEKFDQHFHYCRVIGNLIYLENIT